MLKPSLLSLKRIKPVFFSLIAILSVSFLYNNCSKNGFQLSDTEGSTALASSEPRVSAVSFRSGPADYVNTNSVDFSYDISGDNISSVSAQCYLDQTLMADCSSPIDLSAKPDGDYTLTVEAANQNSLVLAQAKRSFRLDRRSPVLVINSAPSGTINVTSASIAFSVTDNFPGAISYCSLDNAAYAVCTSPYSMSNLAQGAHSVKIYAQDKASNKSGTQTILFSVNTAIAIPSVAISQMPAAFSNSASASFSFSGASTGSTIASYQCSMDNSAFAACSSPQAYSSLAEGSHSFAVKSIDATGQSSSPANYSFAVDVTKPSTPVVSSNQMNPTKSTSLNLTFNSTDSSGVAKYECKLDAGSFAACVSPQAFSGLSSASHTFAVRATDKAGNISAEGSYSIVVDAVAPVVTITAQPTTGTLSTSASFAFSVSDGLSGVNLVECQLDSQAYASCASPQAYNNLAVGTHTFNLRGTDKAGNSSLQSYSWSIAAAPTPTPSITPIQDPTPPPAGAPQMQFQLAADGTVTVTDLTSNQTLTSAQKALYLGIQGGGLGLVDKVQAISNSGGVAVYRISRAAYADAYVDLQVTSGQGLKFVLSAVQNGATSIVSGVSLRFALPRSQNQMACEPHGIHCGHSSLGLTAICLSSNCNNETQISTPGMGGVRYGPDSGAVPMWGNDISWTSSALEPLQGSAFAIFMSSYPYRSANHRLALLQYYGTISRMPKDTFNSTLFWLGAVSSDAVGAATLAQTYGFKDFMMVGSSWQLSQGLANPRTDLATVLSSINAKGLTTGLHYLSARVNPSNPGYAYVYKNSAGSPVLSPDDPNAYIWNTYSTANIDMFSKSYTDILGKLPVSGIYLDGIEEMKGPDAWFRYLSDMNAGTGAGLQASTGVYSRLFPVLRQGVIGDQWSIQNSPTPGFWATNFLIPTFMENLRNAMSPRVGWLPIAGTGGTDQDYEVMLNAAVALGSPFTLEVTGSQITSNVTRMNMFKNKLAVLNQLNTEREIAYESGDFIQMKFADGKSSIGVFGQTSADTSANRLSARVYGANVQFSTEGALFDGTMPSLPSYGSPRGVPNGGYMEVSPSALTVGEQQGFTVETWVKIDSANASQRASLMHKGRGYGFYYNAGTVVGYISPDENMNFAVSIAGPITAGVWSHLAYTYDKATRVATMYINGRSIGSSTASTSFLYSPDERAIRLGTFKGSLASTRVYSRALTATEVAAEAASKASTPASGLVLSLPMTADTYTSSHSGTFRAPGPFFISPLALGIIGTLELRFTGKPANASCSIQVDGQPAGNVAADANGEVVYRYSLNSTTLDLHQVSASCP